MAHLLHSSNSNSKFIEFNDDYCLFHIDDIKGLYYNDINDEFIKNKNSNSILIQFGRDKIVRKRQVSFDKQKKIFTVLTPLTYSKYYYTLSDIYQDRRNIIFKEVKGYNIFTKMLNNNIIPYTKRKTEKLLFSSKLNAKHTYNLRFCGNNIEGWDIYAYDFHYKFIHIWEVKNNKLFEIDKRYKYLCLENHPHIEYQMF